LEQYVEYFDAFEGFNTQIAAPKIFSSLPVVGNYSRDLNEKAIALAKELGKPWVANSDGHQIKDTGLAYIATSAIIRTDSEENLIKDMQNLIRKNDFICEGKYPSILNWINWSARFKIGCALNFDS